MNASILDPDVWADLRELPAADLAHIVETYLHNSLAILTTMRREASADNQAGFHVLLHQLQGSSASIGVQALPHLCAEVRHQLREGALVDLRVAVQRIETTYGREARALEAERAALLGLRNTLL
jgi:HPt (histidine-containing phosphotransfer) domain-containing protein